MSKRLYYIDWIRVIAVALLIPFHSARVFNVGELFYAKNGTVSYPLSVLIGVIDVWHMPLLFALAGASSYFALSHRTGGQYLGERGLRLGVPLLFGTLVVVPPQMWFGAMTNAGYKGSLIGYWPRFFSFRADMVDYYGAFSPAHLWFVLFLLLISLIALPFMTWWRRGGARFAGAAAKRIAEPLWWFVPQFALLVSESFPEVGGKNLGRFLVFFLLGYLAMADAAFMESAERRRALLLVLTIAGTVGIAFTAAAADATPDPSWARLGEALLVNTTAWAGILAALGWGKRLLDRPSPLLSYAAEASYPFYILHQTVIVAVAFYIVQLSWPVAAKYVAIMVAATAVSLAVYEAVRRVPPLRFLFGMKRRPQPVPAAAEAA